MKRSYDELIADEPAVKGEQEDDDIDLADVAPYDAKTEALPDSPVYTQKYEDLRESISGLVRLLKEPLEDSTYRDAVVEGLLDEADKLSTSRVPDQVRIALVGEHEIRIGKSSVINSLLSIGTIARQGDAGTSCTWVVQEFAWVRKEQKKPFGAEVYFFSLEERQEIIRALLADYYGATEKDDAFDKKSSEAAVDDYATQSTVIASFQALFADHAEFKTRHDAEKFLDQTSSEDDENILDQLYDWADDLMLPFGDEEYFRAEATTPQALLVELTPYQHTQVDSMGDPMPSLWPFVSRIRFGLDIPLLRNDISLVDLPGLSDANKTRAANATRELQKCTHHMIVAEIGRAEDDKTIRDLLVAGYLSRGSGRAIVVLTHADTIDDETIVHGGSKDLQQLDSLREEMKGREIQMQEITKKLRVAAGQQKWKLLEEKEKLAVDFQASHAARQELRIAMRSKAIVKSIQDLYVRLTSDAQQLHIFCVGNAAYRKHQAGYPKQDPPLLSLEGTNIPALRQQLFLTPTDGKVNEARLMIDTLLPCLMSDLNLYVSKTHMSRKDEVEKLVVEPQDKTEEMINEHFKDFEFYLKENVLKFMVDFEADWVEEARDLCQRWAKMYNVANHLEFLKRDGTRKARSRTASMISWNEDLINIKSQDLRYRLCAFLKTLEKSSKDFTRAISKMVMTTGNKIRNDFQVTLMALGPFLDSLASEKAKISTFVEKAIRDFRRDMGNLVASASTETVDNPIVVAMAPIYAEVRLMKSNGKGKNKATPKQRALAFELAVATVGSSVWVKAHDDLEKRLNKLLLTHSNKLKEDTMAFLLGLQKRFNVLCSSKEYEDPQEKVLRKELRKSLIQGREVLDSQIKPLAAACFGTVRQTVKK